jgi:hypothetical protein
MFGCGCALLPLLGLFHTLVDLQQQQQQQQQQENPVLTSTTTV